MKEIKLSCEVITPLFMGGANMEPEIRTQSINGVVRWWFRTLGGSKEEEKRLFGWTGEKSNKGMVKFCIIRKDNIDRYLKTYEKQFNQGGYVLQTGLNYIAFSLDQRFKKEHNKPKRQYLDVGYSFDLKIILSSFLEKDEIKKFLGALWCAFYLGNFGSRARRGVGSIMVREISGDFDNFISFAPKGDIKGWLTSNYEKIRGLFEKPKENNEKSKENNIEIYIFEKLDKNIINEWIKEVQKVRNGKYLARNYNPQGVNPAFGRLVGLYNWRDLLDLMGFTLMAYRSYLDPDYTNAKAIIQGRPNNNIIKRAIFGLPLNFHFSSIKQGNNRGTVFPVKGGEKLRRASPLIYKVIKNEEKLEGLIIFVMDKFLPDDVDLELNGVKLQKPDYTLIKDYLQSLQDKKIIGGLSDV